MRRKKRVVVKYLPKEDPVRKVYRITKPGIIPVEMPRREEVGIPVEIPRKKEVSQ